MASKEKSFTSELLGAAFLMATSAVGPGFLNNTTVFTRQLLASFGFVILLSVALDIFAQLNIWRIIAISGKRAQDLANETIIGSGYLLAALIAFGGLAFNIGNVAGAGLGLNVLTGLDVGLCAIVSALIGIAIFLFKEIGAALDWFAKLLGFVMIALILYVVWKAQPDFGEAALRTFVPTNFDAIATIALVGGTVGGYITFAGAHRLLDSDIKGIENLPAINRGATTGILLTTLIRFALFLASFGVIATDALIDDKNPAASVFQNAAGEIGYKVFGVVMWCAAITSVVGAAYTSVSFFKTFHSAIEKNQRYVIIGFIVISTIIFLIVGRPVTVLVVAGVVNGFVLPIALGLMLIAARSDSTLKLNHPLWLRIAGWLVVALMAGFGVYTLISEFRKLI